MVYFRALRKEDWPWVAARAKPVLTESTKGIVAVSELGAIMAAAAFDNWTKTSCSIHIAIERPVVIRHGFLHEICKYVFVTCGKAMMFGQTPSNNKKALRFNERVGMKTIMVLEDAYDYGVDYVITRMHRDECRWLDG